MVLDSDFHIYIYLARWWLSCSVVKVCWINHPQNPKRPKPWLQPKKIWENYRKFFKILKKTRNKTHIFISYDPIKSDPRTKGESAICLTLFCSDLPPPNPNDVSQAILKRKASPNKLLVDDATNDDNSVCCMNTATMEQLQLFRGFEKLSLSSF
jgi:hypothetical protein